MTVLKESRDRDDSDLSPTRVSSESLIDNLRATKQFSSEQLRLIHNELIAWSGFDPELNRQDLVVATEKVIGGYRIEALLGEGGAGHVYRARPIAGGDSVALKSIKNLRLNERFKREMQLAQHLAHPNVVIAYEVGEHEDVPYIVMEELTGPDLHQHVVRAGPISWEESIHIMLDAARGLEHAHERGLIHRDVKPGNLMFHYDRVKVADLGLAALSETQEHDSKNQFNTDGELCLGTPEFMAPEQAKSLKAATAASDIYALGATWFFLLTGRPRVRGGTLGEKLACLLYQKGLEELPSECAPDEVRRIWSKMIAHKVDDRYATMSEVTKELENVCPTVFTQAKQDVHVLVVEDDQDDMLLTVELLKRGNSSVTVNTANTLRVAIQQAMCLDSLDVVLLDLRLPDSSGVETVKRMREAVSKAAIIVLTGQDDLQLGQACIEAGADEFACKNDLNAHLLERTIFITMSRCSHSS
ncbi:protein kinase [Rubripirellula amarantea]|nr:protein kinase [Rubripirellula amarantea]